MRELKVIRRLELASVLLTVGMLLTVQLYMEIAHHNSLLSMDKHALYANFDSYNRLLHNFFPLIIRALFLVGAWYIFHYQVYPKIKAKEFKEKTLLSLALVIVAIAAGIFLYYYFRLYLQVRINHNIITSISTYSLYRKLTLFSDTVGILIVIGIYELFAQLYYYIHKQLAKEKEFIYRSLSYFFLACIILFLILFAFISPFPAPLWQGSTAMWLLISGLLLLVIMLQEFVFYFLLPFVALPLSPKFIRNLCIYLLMGFAGIYIVWGCYSGFRGFSSKSALLFFLLLFASFLAYIRSIFTREKSLLQTQVSAKSAQLSSLRSQINPHFLFNALNSLYATALKENSEKTADGIQKLGDMMRFMLEENNQEYIPLDKEIEYLQNYIELQRFRIDEKQGVEIRVNIQQPEREIYIAPMMLNPFVENAFKHGVSLQHPSWIYITLTLDASRLYFKVHNSLHSRKENDPETYSSGVGLDNVKKRLELIYPKAHSLDIQQSDKDFFISLTLTY